MSDHFQKQLDTGNIDVVISYMYTEYANVIVAGLSHCTLYLNLATLTGTVAVCRETTSLVLVNIT